MALGLDGRILSYLEKIPDTFWGVVVGSLFTIIGVALTSWSNTRRLRRQLQHDIAVRNRERDLALRRDVYLAASEAISAGIGAVARFGDLAIPHERLLQPFTDRAPAIAKMHIVATDSTMEAVGSFMGELTGGFFRLGTKRVRLTGLQQRLVSLQQQLDTSSRERDRLLELMKEINLAGAADQRQWGILQERFEFEAQRTESLLKGQQELQASLFPAQMALTREALDQVAALNRLLVPLVACVRAELDLPFDKESYALIMDRNSTQLSHDFDDFMRDLAADLDASVRSRDAN